MGFFDWVGRQLEKVAAFIAAGIRKFVVYSALVFFFGMLVGARLAASNLPDKELWFFAPLAVAFFSYLYTEIAAVFFVIILIFFLFLFIA